MARSKHESKVAYFPILTNSDREFELALKHGLLFLENKPPEVPYFKLQIKIIEHETKYQHERKK